MATFPIIDLHCDLLSYLDFLPGSGIHDVDAIGCALPHLKSGGVRVQVMAVFALTEAGSAACGERQMATYTRWGAEKREFMHLESWNTEAQVLAGEAIYTLLAIENASCFAEEDEPMDVVLERLSGIIASQKPLYITLTHHAENRFGGGNFTSIGLKDDGRRLLEFLSGQGVAVDMSHTSDLLARGILDHIDALGLDIPVLASHSNFRPVWNHARNLPDWLSHEIRQRGGLVGLNFIRDFVHPENPEALLDHLRHGQALDIPLAWAADYFSPLLMPPQFAFREPYFHPEHAHAGKFPAIMESLELAGIAGLNDLAWGNAWRWIRELRGNA